FAMHELSNDWNKSYKKSARIVGDVIGKYHPHGDTAVYDTIVRMAQTFSLRYPLVDGQGNFGSVDGDNAAAMRYTEIRMSKIAHELLADIDKETVDFGPNYDGSEHEPLILPAKFPNLLVNGSSGIAVGMATNIPPHNLNEIVDACLAVLRDPTISIDDLIEIVPAPDFPTAGIIYGTLGVKEGYRTGRGRVVMRAKVHFEEIEKSVGREAIIVDELPYQVNKANLCIKIGELVREKRLEGISEIRDESDKSGMRMVIELKRGEVPEIVLNNLYKHTQMQDTFGMNMVAILDGQPRLLNLKQILEAFLRHRREVITRRTQFELKKARDRGHILEGLAVALANVDEIIALIKSSATPPEAKAGLLAKAWRSGVVEQMLARVGANEAGEAVGTEAFRPLSLAPEFGLHGDGYFLTEVQAQAILDLRLQRLTGLEQDKIVGEYGEVMVRIADLLDILDTPERVTEIITTELGEIKAAFGDKRRSEIIAHGADISLEDLITPQDMVVTLSNTGYIKSQPLDEYRTQKRGGRGKQAAGTKEEDFIEKLFIANTHDFILCFTNLGRMFWLKVYEVPQGGRIARGKPIVNLLKMEQDEKVNAILPVKEFDENHFIFMATSLGTVKKTPLSAFSRPRTAGLIAVDLDEGDFLVGVAITNGSNDVMLFSDEGKANRFDENAVRAMGRGARGVRGIRLSEDARVIALLVADNDEQSVMTATEHGFGKRTPVGEYTRHGRGGQGLIAISTSARNGKVVAATLVNETDEVMLITTGGVLIRTRVSEIRSLGRSTQGVTLINLDAGEKLSGLQRILDTETDVDVEPGVDVDADPDSGSEVEE
ncbi:MAG: DNA gyrase subunit A, partial [Pseudomonadota bacterium]|nr:DNA gyrase subunit A [Pseudomonadota bacterium]